MKLLNWITEHELDLHSDDIGCVFGSPPCQGSKVSAPQPVPLARRWNSSGLRASAACRSRRHARAQPQRQAQVAPTGLSEPPDW